MWIKTGAPSLLGPLIMHLYCINCCLPINFASSSRCYFIPLLHASCAQHLLHLRPQMLQELVVGQWTLVPIVDELFHKQRPELACVSVNCKEVKKKRKTLFYYRDKQIEGASAYLMTCMYAGYGLSSLRVSINANSASLAGVSRDGSSMQKSGISAVVLTPAKN